MLQRWKRAVVHLECATDSEHFHDRIRRIDEQRALLDHGQITYEQFAAEIGGRCRDLRFHGTALLLSHSGRRYLLTARHVVWNEHAAKQELEAEAQKALAWPEHMRDSILLSAVDRAQQNIFNMIFRVRSIDEVIAGQDHPTFLMNLGAGGPLAYSFSEPDIDLALISLDQCGARFANELSALGYEPIPSESIADGPDEEGQDVFTVGFPSATALLGQMSQHPATAHWSSSHYSLPVSSFGRVSMLHNALPFFWVDMSIYPGNSGGPVVSGDRLVGVVSAQATLPMDQAPEVRTRIPFGKIVKASNVRALLAVQAEKDRRYG